MTMDYRPGGKSFFRSCIVARTSCSTANEFAPGCAKTSSGKPSLWSMNAVEPLSLAWGDECQAILMSRCCAPSLQCIGTDRRGASPREGREERAPQPCIRRTQRDPDHDAAKRIGVAEAPKRWVHSTERRQRPWDRSEHHHLGPSSAVRRVKQTSAETVCDCSS